MRVLQSLCIRLPIVNLIGQIFQLAQKRISHGETDFSTSNLDTKIWKFRMIHVHIIMSEKLFTSNFTRLFFLYSIYDQIAYFWCNQIKIPLELYLEPNKVFNVTKTTK